MCGVTLVRLDSHHNNGLSTTVKYHSQWRILELKAIENIRPICCFEEFIVYFSPLLYEKPLLPSADTFHSKNVLSVLVRNTWTICKEIRFHPKFNTTQRARRWVLAVDGHFLNSASDPGMDGFPTPQILSSVSQTNGISIPFYSRPFNSEILVFVREFRLIRALENICAYIDRITVGIEKSLTLC